jgi:nucleoside 2-deoxyribosyltransferase
MSKKKIRCFVALALGRDDVDLIYDNHIYPVLTSKKINVDPFRIDRKQHNDDLNITIKKEIENSDIAIADLTYTRPSVYWEAGYAERSIPVIYTVRADHLKESQTNDSLRIHFDLKMKNIIDWQSPEDPTFSRRLKERVEYLIRPINQKREIEDKQENERKKFSALSIMDRCKIVHTHFSSRLKKEHFKLLQPYEISSYTYQSISPAWWVVATKMEQKKVTYCSVIIGESLTIKQIKHITSSDLPRKVIPKHLSYKDIQTIEEHHCFCSLKKFPISRLTSVYPQLTPTCNPSFYTLFEKSQYSFEKDRHANMWIFTPIDSETRFKEQVEGFNP